MADIDNSVPGLRIIQNGHSIPERLQENIEGLDIYDEESIHKVGL